MHINSRMLKTSAVISNALLVIGLVCLFMMKLVLAITFFAVSLSISLVVFNMMFRDRTTMKVIVNASFLIVILAIVVAYFLLSK
ncbi:Uncharacterised protein [Staphylococcus argenteus]|uniref:Uncharacterized protein n=2 Tax=Staphylococcus TaxID=1279 RepID=A0A7U7JR53_9STAP|nr:hypothetical protein V676_00370 [Staphylococcus argenteus]EYL87556.1 hypothetical protein V694_00657 [Staphylococcus argenteus]CDR21007.1 hypothetical protein ERS140095_00716 [Staphylococcus argenteus]CDR59133.1 hypothetical protein ERS140254_01466 [Staphylococcus argenteus]CRI07183.1 conserved membrane hypothetical protein [Staphylococcus argenteus]